MARYDFRDQRLFVDTPLSSGARISLERAQSNYLLNVLRMRDGAGLNVFNGCDGEWRATVVAEKRLASLEIGEQTRPQPPAPDLDYLFAPLKQARLDYMVGKAVEMGVGRLRPVLTQHGQVTKLNRPRIQANVIEAAEQCGVLAIPLIDDPIRLDTLLERWPKEEPTRQLIFCDEGHGGSDPVAILRALPQGPLAVLIGPEGGFSADERERLTESPFVTAIPLGPRILRADTAAVAALALVQATLGDWPSAGA